MTKEVLLTLQGLQFDQREEDAEKIETVTVGDYFRKNDRHYVVYEEVTEGFDQPTKNRLKFSDHMVELTRNGLVNVHMVFQENKKNLSNYNTPFGQILVGIDTKRIQIEEKEDNIVVDVDYALDINYEFFSDCHIRIDIRSKENSGFTLLP
ncbi:MAG: DUF1934 domain-containing protein [Bacteroidales bacterium]|nr:DUF1934 domain-containing protein [Bacteroidales bacterium]MCM1415734.1 DUF1934 domain-containing protein [bacterium]MCM1423688.1 DUF1934 domain-containing protein [bacterium]